MKKVLYVLLDLLTIAFLVGGYVIQYFTKKKLGMLRWVNYKQSKIQESMPADVLKYAAVIVVLILTVMIVRSFMEKRTRLGRMDAVMVAVLVVLAVVYLGFTLFVTSETVRSYYLVMPMIGAASLMQVIRNGIAVWMCKDEK